MDNKNNINTKFENNENTYLDSFNKILETKNGIVNELLELIRNTNNHVVREKTILFLIDNFKDDKILPCLLELIKRPDLQNYNAFIVFACGEYSDCKENIEFFFELVLNYDFHVAWNAAEIIIKMRPPFEKQTISNFLNILIQEKPKIIGPKIDFFENLIEFFEYYISYDE